VFDLVEGRVPETNVRETFVQIYIQLILCSLHSVLQKQTVGSICYEPHNKITAWARIEPYEGFCISSVTRFLFSQIT
jgi:hypothetical protein